MDLSDIFSGQVTPAKWRALGEYLQTTGITTGPGLLSRKVGNKTVLSAKRFPSSSPRQAMPFEVTCEKIDGTWNAKIARGVVGERVIGEDIDTVTYWEPTGMLDVDGKSIAIPVASGNGIFVVVQVLETGQIGAVTGDPVSISVVSASGVSVSHFVPAVADESGTAGTYKYRLGTVTITGDECTFEADLAGSNISHWNDLPSFIKEAGDYDIFKKFDLAERAYKTKGLTEAVDDYDLKSIKITDTGDELKFATDGGNLDVIVQVVTLEVVDPETGQISKNYIEDLNFYFRNGLYVGTTDPGGDPGDSLTLTHVVDWS